MAIKYPETTTFGEAVKRSETIGATLLRPSLAKIREIQAQRRSQQGAGQQGVSQQGAGQRGISPTASTHEPVSPISNSYLQRFKNLGAITTQYGGNTKFEGFHPGLDIAAPTGTKVPAFAGGTVVGERTGMGWTPGSGSFGNYVIIEDASGAKHRYSHLNQAYVKLGQVVTPGMAIGEIGKTGGSYSLHGGDPSHLDYRIVNAAGKYLNPALYLK